MSESFAVAAAYKFVILTPERVVELKAAIEDGAARFGVKGLLLLGIEGINFTVAAASPAMNEFKSFLCGFPEFSDLVYKDSASEKAPFRRFKVDIRKEIVTFSGTQASPEEVGGNYLSPAEWHELMNSGEEIIVLDTRNRYETKLGVFKGAIDPQIDAFGEFDAFVERANLPRDKKILMYCTGGIRCEKALPAMKKHGYENVYQLKGGILKFFEEFPNTDFEGECFVFDHRVSVTQSLEPSQTYKLCPHCGDPASTKIKCSKCGVDAVVCGDCLKESHRHSCSKNCAYHLKRTPEAA